MSRCRRLPTAHRTTPITVTRRSKVLRFSPASKRGLVTELKVHATLLFDQGKPLSLQV